MEAAVAESLLLKDLRTFFDRKTGAFSDHWVYRVNPRHPLVAEPASTDGVRRGQGDAVRLLRPPDDHPKVGPRARASGTTLIAACGTRSRAASTAAAR